MERSDSDPVRFHSCKRLHWETVSRNSETERTGRTGEVSGRGFDKWSLGSGRWSQGRAVFRKRGREECVCPRRLVYLRQVQCGGKAVE